MSCTNYGENRAFLWRCGRNLFQDDTPAYGNKSSVDENNVVWTCLTFPENFHFPLRALETTWSSIFLVDNQGHLFYRGPYFLQDWTDYPSSIQNQSQHSSSWLPLVNPDICDIQSLSASSNLLVLIADGGAKLVVFPSSNIGSSSPSLQHWSSWSSDSTICYYQSVATGRDHFLVIVDEGDVYGWGTNDYGQLGIGWEIQSDQSVHIQCKYSHQLTRIEAIPSKMAQKVACCDMSSAVLLKNGRVIVFGNNLYLQLGTHLCCPIQLPQRLDTFSEDHPALDIALSGWQLAVLGCQGEIWISGKEPIHPLVVHYSSSPSSSSSPPITIQWLPFSSILTTHSFLIAGRRYFLLQTPNGLHGYGSGLKDHILSHLSTSREKWIAIKQWTYSTRQRIIVSGAENDLVIYYEERKV